MKEECEFSTAKRGPVTSSEGKTRITLMFDDEVIKAARERAENVSAGYQTVINHLLRQGLLSETAHNLE
ncbi:MULTISPECIES: BrnA antitoxin family protein [unclassified Pseudomonas]|uniref:BrnA antitoxin family protein n=1 Tax=unclassified Pseudomonas TaxID=196821 RepID=UPI0030DB3899